MPKGKNTPFNVTLLGMLLLLAVFTESPHLHGASLFSSVGTMITCHFFHANLFHFACNAMCLWLMRPSPKQIAMAFPFAVFSMLFTEEATIGFSAVIYAYLGMNIFRWNISLIDWGTFIVANLISAFIPGIAFGVHLAAFMFGATTWWFEQRIKRILLTLEYN